MKRRGIACFVAGCAVTLHAWTGFGQEPLTPGRLALQMDEQESGPAAGVLRQSLRDPRPEMRGMAARIAGVTLRQTLYDDLAEALERETDGPAAAEQVRALLYLRGTAATGPVRSAAERLPGEPVAALAEWLARTDAAQFVAASGLFRKTSESSRHGVLAAAVLAANGFPSHRGPVSEAVVSFAPAEAWRRYLDAVTWDGSESLAIRHGLSGAADVREQTVWWALRVATDGREIAPESAALLVTPVPDDTAWTGVGRELLDRRRTKQRGRDLAAEIAAAGPQHLTDVRLIDAARELSAEERAAARKILPAVRPGDISLLPVAAATVAARSTAVATLRLIEPPRPGFLTDIFAAAGCPFGDVTTGGAARLTFHPDGRPKQIAVADTLLKPACARVLRTLARLTTAAADESVVPDVSPWIYLPTNKDIIACVDSDRQYVKPLPRIGGGLVAPKKTRNVNPIYPQAVVKEGAQGLVVIDSMITESGCVRRAKVIRSAHPALDLAAMNAVVQWRYTPTRIDNTAVPVAMTVTVNFTLQ